MLVRKKNKVNIVLWGEGVSMIVTDAERKFNDTYLFHRTMLVTGIRSKGTVTIITDWIRHEGRITAEKAEAEIELKISSDWFRKVLSRQSEVEQDEMYEIERISKDAKKHGDDE